MKMFKKIMAVALTAVMAVSMLTGCAVTDAFATSKLKTALKSSFKTTAGEVTVEEKDDYKDIAKKVTDYYGTKNGAGYNTVVADDLYYYENGKADVLLTDTAKAAILGADADKYVVVVAKQSEDAQKVANGAADELSECLVAKSSTSATLTVTIRYFTGATKADRKSTATYTVIVAKKAN